MGKLVSLILLLINVYTFGQQSIFWKISKDGNNSYLLGTYHYFGKEFFNDNDIIFEKLKSCKSAFSENIDSANTFIGLRNENQILSGLDKKDISTLKEIVPKYVDSKKMTLRELLVTIDGKISTKFCFSTEEKRDTIKLDDYLKYFAIKNNIKLYGLEPTYKTFQYINNSLYPNIEDEKLLTLLKNKINFLNSNSQKLDCRIVDEYRTKKHTYNFEKEFPQKMVTDRNLDWINVIDEAINRDKNVFIFVGLFHLDFKSGLIELLIKKGYTVEPIELN